MKKQKIALAALGLAGLVLVGTTAAAVAQNGNNTYRGFGSNPTATGQSMGHGTTATLQYLISTGMDPLDANNTSGGTNDTGGGKCTGRQAPGQFPGGGPQPNRRMNGHQGGPPRGNQFNGATYLNTTRIEDLFGYSEGTYLVGTTPLYLGNEWSLENHAQSDYDRDGTYEYLWQELDGLVGTTVIVNGVLQDGILYATHINGIWVRPPVNEDITTLEGILGYDNETQSYLVDGTGLILKKRGFSRSDIDGDGALEPLFEELTGLVGTTVTVDGTLSDGALVIWHINGISVA